MDQSFFTNYIGMLQGAMVKTKNFHWASKHNDIHSRLDEFYEELNEYTDSIAEGYQGAMDVSMESNCLNPNFPSMKNPSDMIDLLSDKVEIFDEQLPKNSTYAGLKSITDDFIQTVKKYKYLFGLCDQTGF